jgi:hypothetical protein
MGETTRNSDGMTSRKGLHDLAMRLAQFQFPGDEPADAEKTLEIRPLTAKAVAAVRPSVARPTPNTTQEIDAADVLEVEPIEHHPCSVIPVALDVEVAARRPGPAREVVRSGERVAMPRRGIGWGLGAAIVGVGCLVLVLVNVTRASAGPTEGASDVRPTAAAGPVRAASAVAPPSTALVSTASTAAASGVPLVSVLSLPRVVPTTGTIRLIESAAAHRLFVDGVVQTGTSAVVTCGKHMIQVGSAGRAHALMIGCGEETVIAR